MCEEGGVSAEGGVRGFTDGSEEAGIWNDEYFILFEIAREEREAERGR